MDVGPFEGGEGGLHVASDPFFSNICVEEIQARNISLETLNARGYINLWQFFFLKQGNNILKISTFEKSFGPIQVLGGTQLWGQSWQVKLGGMPTQRRNVSSVCLL
jgi:hypothetical protein